MNINDLKTLEELLRNKHNRSEYIARVEAIYNAKTTYPKELNKLKIKKLFHIITSVIIIAFIVSYIHDRIKKIDGFFDLWSLIIIGCIAVGAICLTIFICCVNLGDISRWISDRKKWIDYGLQLENINKAEASVAYDLLNGKSTLEALKKPLADMDVKINQIASTIPKQQRLIIFQKENPIGDPNTSIDFAMCIGRIISFMECGESFYSACKKEDEQYWEIKSGVRKREKQQQDRERIRNMEKNLSDIADGIRQGNADAERRYEEEKFRQEMRDIFRR